MNDVLVEENEGLFRYGFKNQWASNALLGEISVSTAKTLQLTSKLFEIISSLFPQRKVTGCYHAVCSPDIPYSSGKLSFL